MRLIILLASILLYFLSPNTYSYPYVLLIFGLFVISGYFSVKEQIKKKEYLSFNVLFLVSFFLTSFAYPVFIKPIDLNIALSYIINDNFITKSTAICQIAFSSYVYGLRIKKNSKQNLIQHNVVRSHPIIYFYSPLIGLLFFLIGFIIVLAEGKTINFTVGWSSFMYTLFIIYTIVIIGFSGRKSILYKKKIYLLIAILISAFLLLFIIGDRGIILSIIVALISVYSFYIRKIRIIYIIIFSIISAIFLFTIAQVRFDDNILKSLSKSNTSNVDSNWEYFSDLTSISRNVYVGYEYKEKYGLYKPERILFLAISPIPYLPTLISKYFFIADETYLSSSSAIITNYSSIIDNKNTVSGGLGTHCVIDVYISWGLIGTILLFILVGYIVNLSYSRIYCNIYYACSYFGLTAYAIYIPRSTIFDAYRLIVLLIILAFIFKKYSFRNSSRYLNN